MHILRLLSLFILLFSLSSFTESTNIKENIATKATVTVATTLTNKGNPKKKTYSPPKKKNSKTVASKKNNKIAQKRKVAVRHNAKRKTVASAKRESLEEKILHEALNSIDETIGSGRYPKWYLTGRNILSEQPLNIILYRDQLEDLATSHWLVTRKEVIKLEKK